MPEDTIIPEVRPPKSPTVSLTRPVSDYFLNVMREKLEQQGGVRRTSEWKRRAAREGLDLGVVDLGKPAAGSAFWLPRESSKNILTWLKQNKVNLSARKREEIKRHRGRSGLVLFGEGFRKPGILAHELGHAFAQEKGNVLERGATDLAMATGPRSLITHVIPSAVLAGLAGRRFGPIGGALGGVGAGLVTNAPTLLSELAANRYAGKFLTEEEKEATKGFYTPQWLRYASGSALPFGLLGGLVGAIKKFR